VALNTSLGKDTWAAVAPDIAKLRPQIDEGDKVFDNAADELTGDQANEFLAVALQGLTDAYAQNPPPARFRFEVNPLVTWIWIGSLIAVLGGLLAGWPAKRGLTKIASAEYAARVGKDVRQADPETETESVPA